MSIEELQMRLDAARQNLTRLQAAHEVATERWKAACKRRVDLSGLDPEQLAAGAYTSDAESAWQAMKELERRRDEAQKEVQSLRWHISQAETAPAIAEYLATVEELTADFAALAERIAAAEALIAAVPEVDPRVFRISRLRRELESTVSNFDRWQHPKRSGTGRLWRNPDGTVQPMTAETFARMERERLEKLRPRVHIGGTMGMLQFFDPSIVVR